MTFELDIPKHWEWITLSEDFIYVPTGVQYFETIKKYYSTGGIRSEGQTPEGEYTFDTKPSRANRIVKTGDVLQARMKNTNKALIINDDLNDSLFSTGFFQLRPYPDTYSTKFLFYYLSSDYFAKIKDELCSGSTQSALNDTNAKKIKVPLPPLNEQKLIVEKLDEIFSEINNGIENLTKAKEQLKIYRQSLLKDAFEGKLTEEWRKNNQDKIEDIETLLEQIKIERKKLYNQKIQEWEYNNNLGKKTTKPKRIDNVSSFNDNELSTLLNLPNNWKWIKAGELFEFVTSGSRGWAKYYSNNGSLFIRITNLNFNSLELDLDPNKIQYVKVPKSTEGLRTKINKNDFLFSITGYLGMFAIAPELEDAYVNQHIALARPFKSFLHSFVGYYVISEYGGIKHLNNLQKGAVKAGLRLDDIRNFPVPLCCLNEQKELVKILKSKFAKIKLMEKDINDNLKKSELLIQSTYNKAFSGELIDYDSNDLTAKDLINKIKVEKKKYLDNQKIKKKLKAKKKVEKLEMKILEILETNLLGLSPEELFSKSIYSKENEIDKFYDELNKLLKDKKILENRMGKEKEKILIKLNKKS